MKKTLLSIFILVSLLSASQTVDWAKRFGSSLYDESWAVASDANGNVFTTGHFIGVVDFDPGVGIANDTSMNNSLDVFVSKLDVSGNMVWTKQLGGPVVDVAYAICLDALGNVYVTGRFDSIADFDPGPGVYNLSSTGGDIDAFICKLDVNGNFVWAKRLGGSCIQCGIRGFAIQVDAIGNVFTAGQFGGGTIDFDPGVGTYPLTSFGSGGGDIFVLKLDPAGNFLWADQMGGIINEDLRSLILDASGNAYVTGSFENTVDFDPSAGIYNLTAIGSGDIYICKLGPAGNLIWVKQIGGTTGDGGFSLDYGINNELYITGIFGNTVDFDPGVGVFNLTATSSSCFVSKYDSAGNFIFAKQLGSSGFVYPFYLSLDVSDNIWITGHLTGTTDMDPGPGTYMVASAGMQDAVVASLDSAGNFMWAGQLGGTSDDGGRAISANSLGIVYTVGVFKTTADFDPAATVFNMSSNGMEDIFVHKMGLSLSVQELSEGDGIVIYPNPSTGIFTIETKLTKGEVEIYNVMGERIYSSLRSQNTIDLSARTKGIYFVFIKGEGKSYSQKVIIQ